MNLLSFSFHRSLSMICALSFTLLSQAQDVAFAWGRGISGNGIIWSGSTADASGNVYTIGSFTNSADFDPGTNTMNLTAVGSADAFISKLDANGNYVWVIQLGSTGGDDINDVEVDAQGNIYVVGYANGTVDFDPGPGTVTPAGVGFVAKYDKDGNYLWVSRSTGGVALAVDANANVYVTGHSTRGTIYDPTQYANDTYICKLNSSGALQWFKWVGGDKEDIAWSIAVDGDGNAIIGGSFMSATLDVDPGPGVFNLTRSGGGFDVFLIKLDPAGNFVWGGAFTAEYPYDIKTDAGNNVYIAGMYAQTADFDPGPGTYNLTAPPGTGNTFICKLNAAGTLVWVKDLAGTAGAFSFAKAMALDAAGNIYTSGYISGTFDMDPGPNTAMVTSVAAGGPFVSKLDADGNYSWGKVFGGSAQAQSYGIGVDAAQNVYTTGYFSGSIDLDPGPETTIVTAAPNAQGVFINKLIPFAGGSLPLTWLNVEGNLNSSQQATIHWQAAESNVQAYTIEKSVDARTFSPIGSITAKGNGTYSYVFTENATLQQTAWYRILQTDLDGRSSYSTVIRLAGGTARTAVTIYPVPTRDQVTISVTGNELLHTKALLIDRSGRPLKAIYLNKQQTQLSLGNLATGLYFLQLANGQSMTIMRQD